MNSTNAFSVFAPAKLNLFLAITGRRADGFHDLVSVVTPVDFGDTLHVEPADQLSLECDDPAVPSDETNLVLKAARAFQETTGWQGGAKFWLEKRTPMGAGLGGGSSDATAALLGLNQLARGRLGAAELAQVAARVGSDCALFLAGGPVVMRGRGEHIEPLGARQAARFRGRRVLMFKPGFAVATARAYGRMAEQPGCYLPVVEAETRLARWVEGAAPVEALLFNNMEQSVFRKFVALPVLIEKLRAEFGLAARMSGSGSACFALLTDDVPLEAVVGMIREAWGASAWLQVANLT